MEKNGKNGTFFYKERKRTERSFEKNGCPTLFENNEHTNVILFSIFENAQQKVINPNHTGCCAMLCHAHFLNWLILIEKLMIKTCKNR